MADLVGGGKNWVAAGNQVTVVRKQPNYRLYAIEAVFIAFVIVWTTHIAAGKLSLWDSSQSENTLKKTFQGDTVQWSIWGWLVITTVVAFGVSNNVTAKFTAAFAWLILISVVLINGEQFLKLVPNATGIPAGYSNKKPTPGNNDNPTKL